MITFKKSTVLKLVSLFNSHISYDDHLINNNLAQKCSRSKSIQGLKDINQDNVTFSNKIHYTYSIAQYPWHMDMPPMIFGDLHWSVSPIYFVTKFPPRLKPMQTIRVCGCFSSIWDSISLKSPVWPANTANNFNFTSILSYVWPESETVK